MRQSILVIIAATAAFPQVRTQSDPTDSEKISEIASRMLQRAETARAATASKDQNKALVNINDALTDVMAIEAAKPRAPQPLIVPLYTETIQISVREPVMPPKKGAAASSISSANRSSPVAGSKNAEVVHDATGESTRVSVNITQSKQHLQAAKDALSRNDFAATDKALTAIQSDVKAESVVADLPLLRARQNLAAALGQVRAQHYKEAAAALHEASSALGDYSNTKLPHAADADKLRHDVDSLAAITEESHIDSADTENKIARWWNQVSDWFTPPQPPPSGK